MKENSFTDIPQEVNQHDNYLEHIFPGKNWISDSEKKIS